MDQCSFFELHIPLNLSQCSCFPDPFPSCSVAVCQMFRFEVHVRITDETGEHIQHISTATNPAESFLFTSLFDGDTGVMVGGSNPLSNFCADVGEPFVGKTTAEALLSSLRADDLCCGLVDDFVSRTSSKEDGIFLGHQSSWNMGFPHDWNVFVSNSNCSSSNDTCHRSSMKDLPKDRVYKQDSSEEERSSHWSSEEDPNLVEFDSEESKALWESMSKSSDPYNPFFFSGCISTNTNMGNSRREASDTDLMSVSKASEELLGLRALNIWVSRSDSESSSSSWASSDGSSPDIEEESERLLEFFRCPDDPYNPMCFTASTSTVSKQASLTPPEERESFFTSSSEDDEEDQLWKSLCQNDDPYHPLNFQACLHSSQTTKPKPGVCPDVSPMKDKTREKKATTLQKPRTPKTPKTPKTPRPERRQKHHSDSDKTLVHLKRPGQTSRPSLEDKKESRSSTAQYKVNNTSYDL